MMDSSEVGSTMRRSYEPKVSATDAVFDLVSQTTTILLVDHPKSAEKIATKNRTRRKFQQNNNVTMDSKFSIQGYNEDDESDDHSLRRVEDNKEALVELNQELDSFERRLRQLQLNSQTEKDRAAPKPKKFLEEQNQINLNWTDDLELGPVGKGKKNGSWTKDTMVGHSWVTTPDELGRQLTTLRLMSLNISELGQYFAVLFSNLKDLDLSDNTLQELPQLPESIEKLCANLNSITDFELKYDLPNLVHCGLAFNPLEGLPLAFVQHTPNLVSLDLSYTSICDLENFLYSVEPVSGTLRVLSLQGCPCALLPQYRERTIHEMLTLLFLDDLPLSREEKRLQNAQINPPALYPFAVLSIQLQQLSNLPSSVFLSSTPDGFRSKAASPDPGLKADTKNTKSQRKSVAQESIVAHQESIIIEVQIVGGEEAGVQRFGEVPLSPKIVFEDKEVHKVPSVQELEVTETQKAPAKDQKKTAAKPSKKDAKVDIPEKKIEFMVRAACLNPTVQLRDGLKFEGLYISVYYCQSQLQEAGQSLTSPSLIQGEEHNGGETNQDERQRTLLLATSKLPLDQFLKPIVSARGSSLSIHERLPLKVEEAFIEQVVDLNIQSMKHPIAAAANEGRDDEKEKLDVESKEKEIQEEMGNAVKRLFLSKPELSISVTFNDATFVKNAMEKRKEEFEFGLATVVSHEELSVAELTKQSVALDK